MSIIDLIPEGHENAVSRAYLVTIYMNFYGLKNSAADRKMCHDIEMATKSGHFIFHCDHGYFRYKDESDLPYCNSYYRSETSKGWSIINKNKGIKKFLDARKNGISMEDGQLSLFDAMGGG